MGKRNIVSCAACRSNRKKCSEECIFAPHYPPDDPQKFSVVHSVYGTSNISKLLQGIEGAERADAVNSIVYEARERVKDPVNGFVKDVHQLLQQFADLKSQLEVTQTELNHMRSEYDNLVSILGAGSFVYPTNATSQAREDIMFEEVDPSLSDKVNSSAF
ncbi:hypothetical protein SUGI_0307380 [Cryptomeria japonica]|uniref:LOB domain-containing protein 24-like n=1 Tax=Cryptomeria japonica TaxID=3369 RepID=UPI002408AD5A|nr:LOB domain-containing protein 24-like [Cryptomeria japonica]GLJ17650.1 hypothetical protein SUGI_0307380 [Cryptomeria japonica]